METSTLDTVAPLESYRESRQHIFPSRSSMEWYVRQHKQALVTSGALLIIRKSWHANAMLFDQCVIAEGAKAAARDW